MKKQNGLLSPGLPSRFFGLNAAPFVSLQLFAVRKLAYVDFPAPYNLGMKAANSITIGMLWQHICRLWQTTLSSTSCFVQLPVIPKRDHNKSHPPTLLAGGHVDRPHDVDTGGGDRLG